jgi:GntR family transcriptional repressor for pyruvate dehydrogenase complex
MDVISKPKLPDMVSDAIIQYITEKKLEPGQKIPTEKALSELLGIGRTSVREGLRKLEALGLLESIQGNGVFIKEITLDSFFGLHVSFPLTPFLKLTKDELIDLLVVRSMIESSSCNMAVHAMTGKDTEELKKLVAAMERSISDPNQYMNYDLAFHKKIVEYSGNSILPKIFNLTQDLIWQQYGISIRHPAALQRATKSHKDIVAAILKKNTSSAVSMLKKHLLDVQEMVVAEYDTIHAADGKIALDASATRSRNPKKAR